MESEAGTRKRKLLRLREMREFVRDWWRYFFINSVKYICTSIYTMTIKHVNITKIHNQLNHIDKPTISHMPPEDEDSKMLRILILDLRCSNW